MLAFCTDPSRDFVLGVLRLFFGTDEEKSLKDGLGQVQGLHLGLLAKLAERPQSDSPNHARPLNEND